MRLALAMGRPDVDAMLSQLTPKQIREWKAFDQIHPFGNEWLQTGTLIASIRDEFVSYKKWKAGKRVNKSDLSFPYDFLPIPQWFYTKLKRAFRKWQQ